MPSLLSTSSALALSFDAAAAESVAGEAVAITVEGLYDSAGNAAVAVADRVLAAGSAGDERHAIKSNLAAVDDKVPARLGRGTPTLLTHAHAHQPWQEEGIGQRIGC